MSLLTLGQHGAVSPLQLGDIQVLFEDMGAFRRIVDARSLVVETGRIVGTKPQMKDMASCGRM